MPARLPWVVFIVAAPFALAALALSAYERWSAWRVGRDPLDVLLRELGFDVHPSEQLGVERVDRFTRPAAGDAPAASVTVMQEGNTPARIDVQVGARTVALEVRPGDRIASVLRAHPEVWHGDFRALATFERTRRVAHD